METLAIIGLTGTIAQLLDFSAKLISKTTELYTSTTGALDQNVDIELVTNHFAALVEQLNGRTPPSQDLAAICDSCKTISSRLLRVLQGMKGNTKCRTWKSIRHAVRNILKNDEVQALQARLMALKNELAISLMAGLSQDLSQLRIESQERLSRLETAAGHLSMLISTVTLKVDRSQEVQRAAMEALFRDNANSLTAAVDTARQMIQSSLQNEAACIASRLLQDMLQRGGSDGSSSSLDAAAQSPLLGASWGQWGSLPEPSHNGEQNNERNASIEVRRPGRRRKRFLRRADQQHWFGRALVSISEIRMGDDLTHILTECIVIPSHWLLRLGYGVKIQHFRSMVVREAPKFALRPLQILASDSAVITSIKSRDIRTAELIIREKGVSPSAISVDGENLLNLITSEMCKVVVDLHFKSDDDLAEKYRPGYSVEDRRLAERCFYDLRQLFLSVLALGADPAQRSSDGSSAITFLLYLIQPGLNDHFPDDIYALFSSSLSASKDNPFHQPFANVIGTLLTFHCRLPTWEYHPLIERLLEGLEWTICADDGASVANAIALRYLISYHTKYDTKEFESWIPLQHKIYDGFHNFFPRRLRIVERLASNIEESLDEISNRTCEAMADRVIRNTKSAVQLSLLYASPMKGLYGAKEDVSLIRRSIVREVCTIMKAMGLFIYEFEDMLEWCYEWEVLDIWVESLQQAAVAIPQKTRKAWAGSKASYNYSDLRGPP